MTNAQIEALKIIGNEAVETISQAQGATIDQVMQAIKDGDKVALSQFQKLITLGAVTVAAL